MKEEEKEKKKFPSGEGKKEWPNFSPIMNPSPKKVSVQAMILATFDGNSFMRIESTELQLAASAIPERALSK